MTTKPPLPVPRFLAPDLDPAAAEAYLPADESRHLTRVLRLGPGGVISVFDGRGHEWLARIRSTRGVRVTLTLLEPIESVPESSVPFTLVQGVLKGQAMDAVVRDATMMGATAIQPVLTLHTTVKTAFAARPEIVNRWRRVVVASAKQCRRATLPEVREPVPFRAALSIHAADLLLMFVEPAAGADARSMRAFLGTEPPARAALIVGPEGGWASEELELARGGGAALVTLGRLTLRAESVPLAAMAIFRMLWE